MSINIGDKGLKVKYLQTYLRENYSPSVRVTGEYDRYTHNALIEYLHTPTIVDIKEIQSVLFRELTDIQAYFIPYERVNEVQYKAKATNATVSNYMYDIRDELETLLHNNGWVLSEFSPYYTDGICQFIISNNGKQEHFPKSCILGYINQNTDNYLTDVLIDYDADDFTEYADSYGLCYLTNTNNQKCKVMSFHDKLRSGKEADIQTTVGSDDSTLRTKLLMIPCKPNTTYTIVCNSTMYSVNQLQYAYTIRPNTKRQSTYSDLSYYPNNSVVIATTSKNSTDIMYSEVDDAVLWFYNMYAFSYADKYRESVENMYYEQLISNSQKKLINSVTYTTNSTAKYILISYALINKSVDVNSVQYTYEQELTGNYSNYAIVYAIDSDDIRCKTRENGVNDFYVFEGNLNSETVYMRISGKYGATSATTDKINPNNIVKFDSSLPNIIEIAHKLPNIIDTKSAYLLKDTVFGYFDGSVINEFSNVEDIIYLKSLLVQINPALANETDGKYTENIKNFILNMQMVLFKNATKDEKREYVKNFIESAYSSDIWKNRDTTGNYNGKFVLADTTNAMIAADMYMSSMSIFSYSPIALELGRNHFVNATDDRTENGELHNQSEINAIIDEVLDNYPIDGDTVIKYNVSMPTGYVDAETMALIQDKINIYSK